MESLSLLKHMYIVESAVKIMCDVYVSLFFE